MYYYDKFDKCKNDSKRTWNNINSLLNRNKRCNSNTIFKSGNDLVNDPHSIANEFNNFFINIGTNLSADISSIKSYRDFMNLEMTNKNSMFLSPVDDCETINVSMACLKPIINQQVLMILNRVL